MLRSPDFPSALLPLNPEWFPGGHLSQIVGTIGIQQGCGLANPSVSATLQYWPSIKDLEISLVCTRLCEGCSRRL